jgi:hypothetical protein
VDAFVGQVSFHYVPSPLSIRSPVTLLPVFLQSRERRHSSPDLELDVDPDALLETDALGLSKAEKEAEEEAKRLEESRYTQSFVDTRKPEFHANGQPNYEREGCVAAKGSRKC